MIEIPAHFLPDPAGRVGHYLDPDSGDVTAFGVEPPEAVASPLEEQLIALIGALSAQRGGSPIELPEHLDELHRRYSSEELAEMQIQGEPLVLGESNTAQRIAELLHQLEIAEKLADGWREDSILLQRRVDYWERRDSYFALRADDLRELAAQKQIPDADKLTKPDAIEAILAAEGLLRTPKIETVTNDSTEPATEKELSTSVAD